MGWHVQTDHACEAEENMGLVHWYSSANVGDTLDIKIASGTKKKPALGTYIKLFNANYNSRYNVNLDLHADVEQQEQS